MSNIACISLFSGAGGLDLGAKEAGATIVACIENDSDSVQSLTNNFNCENPTIFDEDIIGFDFDRVLDCYDQTKVDATIVIGGPPCQPFSKNGYWVKNENRLVESDPRNLVDEFLRAVAFIRPDGFMLENVESLLHPTNLHVLEKVKKQANDWGYYIQVYKANAADFGVPQKRKRVFVFGFKNKSAVKETPCPTHQDHEKKGILTNLPPYCGVGEFIEKFDGKKYYEKWENAEEGNYYYELKHVPAGKNYIALSKIPNFKGRTFRSGSRFWNFLLKLHPEKPSWTIAAQPGPWVGPFHWDNRRLRVPEIAAIQTFPDDYYFAGSRRSIQRQIGNAVPVKLGKAMVEHLLDHLQ